MVTGLIVASALVEGKLVSPPRIRMHQARGAVPKTCFICPLASDFPIIASMPKRPRQSHIPSQVRKRKPRRPVDFSNALPGPDDGPELAGEVVSAVHSGAAPGSARPRRRLDEVTRAREGMVARTHHAGELPTFERTYLVRELTQIASISGLMLAVIVVLWLVMR